MQNEQDRLHHNLIEMNESMDEFVHLYWYNQKSNGSSFCHCASLCCINQAFKVFEAPVLLFEFSLEAELVDI